VACPGVLVGFYAQLCELGDNSIRAVHDRPLRPVVTGKIVFAAVKTYPTDATRTLLTCSTMALQQRSTRQLAEARGGGRSWAKATFLGAQPDNCMSLSCFVYRWARQIPQYSGYVYIASTRVRSFSVGRCFGLNSASGASCRSDHI
jgi:hypothetical protein